MKDIYILNKNKIDFDQVIEIKQFNEFETIFRKWSKKIETNNFLVDAEYLYCKILEELETKSLLKAAMTYIRSHYSVVTELNQEFQISKTQIQQAQDLLIIRDLIATHDIVVNENKLNLVTDMISEFDLVCLQSSMLEKQFQQFLLAKFKYKFNYISLINYLMYKDLSSVPDDVDLSGVGYWRSVEWWFERYNINFLGKKFTPNFLTSLWEYARNYWIVPHKLDWIINHDWIIDLKRVKELHNPELIDCDPIMILGYLREKLREKLKFLNLEIYREKFIKNFDTYLTNKKMPYKQIVRSAIVDVIKKQMFYDLLKPENFGLVINQSEHPANQMLSEEIDT
ncbi:hypothetical protein J2Z62_000640 [Mycoplasmoides fastidiosum]|uniref:Uncharacterized protein n=1 Tax=Mycoplasmoides fastidiosum TaxID=92758 RepID=A0ABU0LZT5_9BACT|nr:hypothetical protein [Mycoplasmoides fastidiosum]MDQ0514202.1 hypothetical protein [Mycoplasmoides fastidiosum]UUD37388.1 hypothetical protein NPA10_02280 [Mycoplasmoides fastidiosum]